MQKPDKCRPHSWKTPEIGDDNLECTECGRKIDLMEISVNVRSSILNSIEIRRGPDPLDEFKAALTAAVDDRRTRYTPRTPTGLVSASSAPKPLKSPFSEMRAHRDAQRKQYAKEYEERRAKRLKQRG